MTPNTKATLPPALRKARKPEEISNAFPPIIPRPRPEPPPPAPAPVVVAPVPTQSAPAAAPKPASPPTVKPAPPPVKPATLPPVVAGPPALKTRPKPVFTGRPPVAQLDGKVVLLEGTFRHEEVPSFVVETPLTGKGAADKQSLINLARAKHPTGRMELRSTRIITRELGAVASFPKGTSVGQVFGENGSLTENALEIGSVFWGGERCQIFLVNLRSRGSVNIALRQPGGARVSFSNQIAANTPASTLKHVVTEVLGRDARELSISLKIES